VPAEQNFPPYATPPNAVAEADDRPVLLPKRERLFTKGTVALVALLIASGSFALGAHLKHTPTATATSGGAAPANASTFGRGTGATATGATGTGGANGATGNTGAANANSGGEAAGGFGGATVGQITKIDGNTIYVQDNQGNTVTVNTTAATPINVAKPGTIADLTNGETIIVQGTTGAAGAINATSINAGSAFGARGAAGGRGANGTGNGQNRGATTTTAGG